MPLLIGVLWLDQLMQKRLKFLIHTGYMCSHLDKFVLGYYTNSLWDWLTFVTVVFFFNFYAGDFFSIFPWIFPALGRCAAWIQKRIVFMVLTLLNQPKERCHFSFKRCLQVKPYSLFSWYRKLNICKICSVQ